MLLECAFVVDVARPWELLRSRSPTPNQHLPNISNQALNPTVSLNNTNSRALSPMVSLNISNQAPNPTVNLNINSSTTRVVISHNQ
jgi:hypothetical protein